MRRPTGTVSRDTSMAEAGRKMESQDRRIGLIAAYGQFPIRFARDVRRQGMEVVCVAIRGCASPELREVVDRFHWVSIARLGSMIRILKREGVRRAVMAGKVPKKQMFTPWRVLHFLPDWRTFRFFYLRSTRKDNKDDTMLLAIIDEFERDGIKIESALDYCEELLVKPGCLTRRNPTPAELDDIRFGWELAKEMGRLDVGQTVAVKELATLAVEAVEGTDEAILRAGRLCPSGGFTVVKVAKPEQDMRFDVPTIGPDTIESLRRAGAGVLAIEAEKTILLQEHETLKLAERYGIAVVAYQPDASVLKRAG